VTPNFIAQPLRESSNAKALPGWLKVGVSALFLAGLLSLALVIGRAPGLAHLISDENLIRRCLVVHVNLALFVWLTSLLAALWSSYSKTNNHFLTRGLTTIAAAGLTAFTAAAFVPNVQPLLSNYIPVLETPLFFYGIGLYALTILIAAVAFLVHSNRRTLIPLWLRPPLQGAAVLLILAGITFLVSLVKLPTQLSGRLRYELLFWGSGHLLQTTNEVGMMAVWLLLANRLGWKIEDRSWVWAVATGLLVVPAIAGPFWAAEIADTGSYLTRFTRLMQWGIFPGVTLATFFLLRSYLQSRQHLPSSSLNFYWPGLVTGVGLTFYGYLMGASIHRADTMVPAHYHAAIGGVTVTYMLAAYHLLQQAERPLLLPHIWRWQPVLFGVGQALFALGFGIAGMARKVYGAAQIITGPREHFGLVIMAGGGLLAILGGLMFLAAMVYGGLGTAIFHIAIKRRNNAWERMENTPSSG